MAFLTRAFFVIASLVLMLVGAALIIAGPVEIVRSLLAGEPFVLSVLDALSYMILALAVFDVAKYLYEEEVEREREMRQAAETRRSLTKFITVVLIAVFLEGLVNLAKASEGEPMKLIYPVAVILAGVALLISLGVYQRLSATVEEKVGDDDRADEAAGETR